MRRSAALRTEIDLSGSLIYTGEVKHTPRSAETTAAGERDPVFMQTNVSKRVRTNIRGEKHKEENSTDLKSSSSDLLYHTPSVNTENKALIILGRVIHVNTFKAVTILTL